MGLSGGQFSHLGRSNRIGWGGCCVNYIATHSSMVTPTGQWSLTPGVASAQRKASCSLGVAACGAAIWADTSQ